MNNIKHICLILLLILNCQSRGQVVRFNKQYNFGYANPNDAGFLSTNVFKVDNDYIVCGMANILSQSLTNALGVIRTDSLGNQKWQKITAGHNNMAHYNNSASQFFIQLKDKNILVTGQYGIATDHGRSFLGKINSATGDTLWIKEYQQPGDSTWLFCSQELLDSSIISLGFRYYIKTIGTNNYVYHKAFIMKSGKNGDYKWHKYLGNYTSSFRPQFNKMVNLNDKEFIVTGFNYYSTPGQKGFLLKFDTLGTTAFNNTYSVNGYSLNIFFDVIKLNDGNLLVGGEAMTYNDFNFNNTKLRPALVKLNLAGSLLSSKLYGVEKPNAHSFFGLYESPSKNIYASGLEWVFPNNAGISMLYKCNSNLDSLFTRYYDNGLGGTYYSNVILPTNDGGFALPMQSYQATGQQRFRLMKIDTTGCDSVAGCTYPTIGLNEIKFGNTDLKIWPNPANDFLNIEIESVNENNIEVVSIINAFGEVILHEKTNRNKTRVILSSLPIGVYVLNIRTNEQSISKKFIVDR